MNVAEYRSHRIAERRGMGATGGFLRVEGRAFFTLGRGRHATVDRRGLRQGLPFRHQRPPSATGQRIVTPSNNTATVQQPNMRDSPSGPLFQSPARTWSRRGYFTPRLFPPIHIGWQCSPPDHARHRELQVVPSLGLHVTSWRSNSCACHQGGKFSTPTVHPLVCSRSPHGDPFDGLSQASQSTVRYELNEFHELSRWQASPCTWG